MGTPRGRQLVRRNVDDLHIPFGVQPRTDQRVEQAVVRSAGKRRGNLLALELLQAIGILGHQGFRAAQHHVHVADLHIKIQRLRERLGRRSRAQKAHVHGIPGESLHDILPSRVPGPLHIRVRHAGLHQRLIQQEKLGTSNHLITQAQASGRVRGCHWAVLGGPCLVFRRRLSHARREQRNHESQNCEHSLFHTEAFR